MPTSSKISRRTRRRRFIVPSVSIRGKVANGGTIVVCGVDYKILEGSDPQIHAEHNPKKFKLVRGAVNPFPSIIVLSSDMGKSQKETTLLHEVIHAVDDGQDVGLTEDQVGLLASGLYGVTYTGPRKRDKTRTMRGVFYG